MPDPIHEYDYDHDTPAPQPAAPSEPVAADRPASLFGVLHPLGYDQLNQINKDLRSHIPGDASWHAAVGAILRHLVFGAMSDHPDNPLNKPDDAKTLNEKHAAELKAWQADRDAELAEMRQKHADEHYAEREEQRRAGADGANPSGLTADDLHEQNEVERTKQIDANRAVERDVVAERGALDPVAQPARTVQQGFEPPNPTPGVPPRTHQPTEEDLRAKEQGLPQGSAGRPPAPPTQPSPTPTPSPAPGWPATDRENRPSGL